MTDTSEILLARLADDLDSTAKMTQELLSDLREGEVDFAVMKTELNILKDNVQKLSSLIKEGDGTISIITKVAIIEQDIKNINKWIDNHIDIHQNLNNEISDIITCTNEFEKRLIILEQSIKSIIQDIECSYREKMESINKELDIAHENTKVEKKLKAEKISAAIKIISAILIVIVSMVSGYCTKSFNLLQNPTSTISDSKK